MVLDLSLVSPPVQCKYCCRNLSLCWVSRFVCSFRHHILWIESHNLVQNTVNHSKSGQIRHTICTFTWSGAFDLHDFIKAGRIHPGCFGAIPKVFMTRCIWPPIHRLCPSLKGILGESSSESRVARNQAPNAAAPMW
jgi:hypothetical protein